MNIGSVTSVMYRMARALFAVVGLVFAAVALLGVTLYFLPSWSKTADVAYRDRPCVAEATLTGTEAVDSILGEDYDCRTELLNAGSHTFSLNFLEFTEDGSLAGATTDGSSQLETLLQRIEADEKTYLIAFVHGWRNNAARDNGDVIKFRTLLSYAAAFINQRCTEHGLAQYCGMAVRGVYIGWRGSTSSEWLPEPASSAIAAASFMGRKEITDAKGLPNGVANNLLAVEAALDMRAEGHAGSDRMLVIGHSLGGNILLQGFKQAARQSVEKQVPDAVVDSPIGDLLVLINPATSAADWLAVTRAVRSKTRIVEGDRWDADSQKFFPRHQPPAILSLTSTCPPEVDAAADWRGRWDRYIEQAQTGLSETATYPCDWVTTYALPVAQFLLGDRRAHGQIAMGQLVPDVEARPSQLEGLTHVAEINFGTQAETSLANSMRRQTNECIPGNSWLWDARFLSKIYTHWDTGAGKDGTIHITHATEKDPSMQFQFWHGSPDFVRKPGFVSQGDPVTSGRDPFWNATANASAISGHGGYVSYALWCVLNQLVLDDPAMRYNEAAWTGRALALEPIRAARDLAQTEKAKQVAQAAPY